MAIDPKDKLVKANATVAATSDDRTAWQEPFERYQTAPASKSSQAPEILRGFVGSWAGQWAFDPVVSLNGGPDSTSATGLQVKVNRLGTDGLPEINFRPYDWNTTMRGRNGPSLLGHPISFEFVGPTLKGQETTSSSGSNLDFQWVVTDNGTNDILRIDAGAASHSTLTNPALPQHTTLQDIYNLSAIPEEGLYVMIVETGSAGSITTQAPLTTSAGVGDGLIGQDAVITRNAITPLTKNSKFELFRVVEIDADELVLDQNKRLEDYFTVPGTNPVCRAIALIKPKAARLIEVPGSDGKVFSFLPPKENLVGDHWPMFENWDTAGGKSAPHSWLETAGGAADYQRPVPTPVEYADNVFRAEMWNTGTFFPVAGDLGRIVFRAVPNERLPQASDIGKVFHVREVDGTSGMILWDSSGIGAITDPGADRSLGYFEIVDVDLTPSFETWVVYAHASWELDKGLLRWPNFDDYTYNHSSGFAFSSNQRVYVKVSIHEPVETLWRNSYLHPEVLDSTRLKNIIDPAWAGMSSKSFGDEDARVSLSRADKAVFDTGSSNGGADGSNANPGSLLDLGFRPVFFPAVKYAGSPTVWSPDFDSPVDTRGDLVLDPSVPSEDQWVRIDYPSGLVYFSHRPVPGGSPLFPAGVNNVEADNARGELLFFASFVPFSREAGQLGSNPRIAGADGTKNDKCVSTGGSSDVYSKRLSFPLYPQTLTVQGTSTADPDKFEILLDVDLDIYDLPQSGWVTLVSGHAPNGDPLLLDDDGNEVSTFKYQGWTTRQIGSGGTTVTVLQNLTGRGQSIGTTVSAANPATAILRRDILTPNDSFGDQGTDYRQDVTYGFAARASVLRFEDAEVTRIGDGSVKINTRSPLVDEHTELFDDLFSSWVLEGCKVIASVNPNEIQIGNGAYLMKGRRVEIQQFVWGTSSELPNGFDGYVYLDSTQSLCRAHIDVDTSLPLPADDDILLARVTVDGAGAVTVIDLRRPLTDIDKRLDITVGDMTGHPQPQSAHFPTLIEALQYVEQVMSPDTGGSRDGQQHRIRVIGGTVEPAGSIPFILPEGLDGIIIEGAARREDSSSPYRNAITWEVDASLFHVDFTSRGWQFRDLTFVYTGFGADTDPVNRNLIYLDGSGSIDEFVFDNVTLQGNGSVNPHGFMFADADGACSNSTFNNCTFDCSDLGIHLAGSGGGGFNGNVINNTKFIMGTRETVLADTAAVWLADDGVGGAVVEDNRILHCQISGADVGIRSGSVKDIYQSNLISGGLYAGIWLDGSASEISVLDNHLEGVHTAAGGTFSGFAAKVGIALDGSTDSHIFRGNRITLQGGASGDDSIYASTATGVRFSENYCDFDLLCGPSSQISDNIVDGDLDTGSVSTVKGNIITGGLTVGAGSAVSTNVIGGLFDLSSSSVAQPVRFVGNICTVGAGVNLGGDRALIQGNDISTTLDISSVSANGCKIQDNNFSTGALVPILGTTSRTDLAINGNYFESTFASPWTLRAAQGTFSNNFVASALEIDFDDSTELQVVGNYSAGGFDLSASSGGPGSNKFLGNDVGGGIHVQGQFSQVVGNNVLGTVTGSSYSISVDDADNSVVSDNRCASIGVGENTGSANVVVSSNHVTDDVDLVAATTYVQVIGNWIGKDLDLGANSDNCNAEGNLVVGDILSSGSNSSLMVQNNRVQGSTGIVINGDLGSVIGNYLEHATAIIECSTGEGLILGNHVLGATGGLAITIVTKGDAIVSNNRLTTGGINVFSGQCVVEGNYLNAGDITVSGGGGNNVVNTNVIGGGLTVGVGPSIIQGNRVLGDLENTGDDPVITANHIGGDLLQDAADYVVVGNHIAGVVSVVGGGGPDPDAAAGIFVANKVKTGATPFYGGALPGTGPAKENNQA